MARLTKQLIEPLLKEGARAIDYTVKRRSPTKAEGEALDITVRPQEVAPSPAAGSEAPQAPENVAPTVEAETPPPEAPIDNVDQEVLTPVPQDPTVVPEAVEDLGNIPEAPTGPVKPAPASEDEMKRMLDQRDKELGTERQAPSPTQLQKEEGVVTGPFNTTMYDNDGLAATIQSFADKAPELKTKTVQSLYEEAQARGVTKDVLNVMFAGQKMESAVGDSELAIRMAGLVSLHDASATRLDDLMQRMAANQLDDAGELELREAIAQHDIIYGEMINAKRDVARTMNVFKNIKNKEVVSFSEIRSALDSLGGSDNLRAFAEKYNGLKSEGRAKQNRMLSRGLVGRIYDAAVYAAQSVLLMNPVTHLYNFGQNTLMLGILDPIERVGGAVIGSAQIRKRFAQAFGKSYDPDSAMMDDVLASGWALMEGIKDGWKLAGYSLVESQGAKGEVTRNPFTAEYLFKRHLDQARSEGLLKRGFGKMIDAFGTLFSLSFKGLQASDEFIGGYAARTELLREGARLGKKVYQDALDAGKSQEEAISAAQNATQKLLTERPANVQQNIEHFRKMITMTSDPNLGLTSGKLMWKTNRILNHPLLKPITMFSRTVTNIASEGAARSPLFFLSPRFHEEWSRGGRHRDLAMSRVGVGSLMMLGGYQLAINDRITGQGPSATDDRNNLRELGWLPFSFRFYEDEVSEVTLQKLRALVGEDQVSVGKGQFEGEVFVSISRLEPFNVPFLMSAAYADAIKYRAYDPDDTELEIMTASSAAALAEFTTNIPAMTTFAELMNTLNVRGGSDVGDKTYTIINNILGAYSNFAINATPGVNLLNSSLAAYIERITDPTISNTAINDEQAQFAYDGWGSDRPEKTIILAPFWKSYNRLRSRIPVYSKGVPYKLDPLTGDPIGGDRSSLHSLYPVMKSIGKSREIREYLALLNHSVGDPNFVINGVTLSAEDQNRYIELYTKEIRINGKNLEQTLIHEIKEKMKYYIGRKQKGNIGVMRQNIDATVSRFRQIAKKRMFGEFVEDRKDPELAAFFPKPLDARAYGFSSNIIERPEVAQRMIYNYNKAKQF